MKVTINVKFRIGDDVIVKTDPEAARIVSGWLVRGNEIRYGVTKGEEETFY